MKRSKQGKRKHSSPSELNREVIRLLLHVSRELGLSVAEKAQQAYNRLYPHRDKIPGSTMDEALIRLENLIQDTVILAKDLRTARSLLRWGQ